MAQDNQNTIDYLYDAAGTKLRKVTSSDRATGLTTDYSGPFVYEDSKLVFIQTSEGRIVPDHDTYAYEYFLKDHLGNTRVMFSEQGEVLQDNSYYPFGGIMEGLNYTAGLAPENKHLYNGKELQDDFGLDWYDYGARFYDAQLARFHTVDPLAEDYTYQSPFVYALNSPISFIDWMGMSAGWYIKRNGKIIGEDGNDDEKIHLVTNRDDIKTIKTNDKDGKSTELSDVTTDVTTTVTELEESLDVLGRTEGLAEETSVVTPDGKITRGETGTGLDGGVTSATLPYVEGDDNTSIHSHPTATTETTGFNALKPGPDDPTAFEGYKSNIIVGPFGDPKTDQFGYDIPRTTGAAFFGRNITTTSKPKAKLTTNAIDKVLKKTKRK